MLTAEHFREMHQRIDASGTKEELLQLQEELRLLSTETLDEEEWMVRNLLTNLITKARSIPK